MAKACSPKPSELISARIELIDLAASSLDSPLGQSSVPVSVYKKFDKIMKCYIAYAAKRKISFTIDGDSRSQTRGIEHFEMIPLIVIDNAVKYSPNNKSIEIVIREESNLIYATVISLGPKIKELERKSIFEREFRGENAIKSGKSGSGIGLYFAQRLLASIGAKISVEQDDTATTFQTYQYYSTKFKMIFQKS